MTNTTSTHMVVRGTYVVRSGIGLCWLASDGAEYSCKQWIATGTLARVDVAVREVYRLETVTSGLSLFSPAVSAAWEIERALARGPWEPCL